MNRSLQWDIFCKVIDNFGDIGVCWRLACDLARRGHSVRLWVDDASALGWMAPKGCKGVRLLPWSDSLDMAEFDIEQQPPEVLIEAFGCEIAPEFLAAFVHHANATGNKPLWINLEYLSAESYVERCHGLPSPVQNGPAAGWVKWFFYPGFTEATGGLLREPDLMARQSVFNRNIWLAAQGLPWQGEKLISLFCYEPIALRPLLDQLALEGLNGEPVRLLVAAGRPEKAVKTWLLNQNNRDLESHRPALLSISYLPFLTQTDFDHLLWACDMNFVRGEDSVVRALWAGKPFVWQIYPQDDEAHLAKLTAFLDMLDAPASLRAFHATWNQGGAWAEATRLGQPDLPAWKSCALSARSRLMAQDDLSSRLLGFVEKTR